MLPVSARVAISAPREQVFDLVADLAYREAWMDHCISELRLTHPKSSGQGAAARYRLGGPFYRPWLESQIAEAERPRRILEVIRGGRNGRTHGEVEFELSRQGRDMTRVEMTIWTEPGTPRERFMEKLGARPWMKRQTRVALERLRAIFEERPDAPLRSATVAAWEPHKAPRFGVGPSSQPKVGSGPEPRASSG